MTIDQIVKELDSSLTVAHEAYTKLHEQLNSYRGKRLSEQEVEVVNKLLFSIQEGFKSFHSALHFISYRYQWAVNTANGFHDFLEDLKKAGAQEVTDKNND